MIKKVHKHTVEFYSSAETMPIMRYQKFNKYLMIDNEVGSTIGDYDKRMSKAIQFVHSDMKTEALKELENNRQNVFHCLSEYSPKNKAIAILVKKIGNREYTSIDSDTLDEIEQKLDEIGFTKKMMDETISDIKKK